MKGSTVERVKQWWNARALWVKVLIIVVGAAVLYNLVSPDGGFKQSDTVSEVTSKVTRTTTTDAPVTTTEAPTTTITTVVIDTGLAYKEEVVPILIEVSNAMIDASPIFERFPMWNDDDFAEAAVCLGLMQSFKGRLEKLTPPPGWEAMHSKLMESADHMYKASDLVARGIDSLDADLIAEGTVELIEGNKDMTAAGELLPQ